MQQTLTAAGPRPMTIECARIYVARTHEQQHLVVLRLARAQVCGCQRCDDGDRGTELDVLIRISLERAAYLSNQITDRSRT